MTFMFVCLPASFVVYALPFRPISLIGFFNWQVYYFRKLHHTLHIVKFILCILTIAGFIIDPRSRYGAASNVRRYRRYGWVNLGRQEGRAHPARDHASDQAAGELCWAHSLWRQPAPIEPDARRRSLARIRASYPSFER